MISFVYLVENAIKNLIRNRHQFLSLILFFIISMFVFMSLFLRKILSIWKMELSEKNNLIALLPVEIFYYSMSIITCLLVVFLILYTKNSFRSFILLQQQDIITMSFLGATSSQLGVEFALQPVCCLLVILPSAAIVSKKIISQFLYDIFPMQLLDEKLAQFSYTTTIILPITIGCCIISFVLNYLVVRRILNKQLVSSAVVSEQRCD